MTARRGFSLIEVMIALVAAALIGSLAAVATGRLQMAGRSRAERSGLVGSLRAVVGVLETELRSLGNDSVSGADHQIVAANSLTFRAHRGLVVACRVAVDTVILALDRLPAFRSRLPASGRDSLLLYIEGDSTGTIDAWLPLPILAGPTAASCPGGWPGWLYSTRLAAADLTRYRIPPFGLGRFFEFVNARAYSSATGPHFGVEGLSAGAVVQPVAGPLRPAGGLEYLGFDRAGSASATPFDVVGFDLVIRGLTSRDLAVGPGLVAPVADSARGAVRLRNAR